MTRVRDLDFVVRSALYAPDGSGAAEIERTEDVAGGCWSRVTVAGGGLDGYLHIRHRADEEVFAVDGDADSAPPRDGRTDLDGRLRPLGAFFPAASLADARREAETLRERLRAQNEAIRASTFEVSGLVDGRSRRVRVGPTVAGRTSLECLADEREGTRVMYTSAERAELERAQRGPVEIEATFTERRPVVGGMRTRSVMVSLSPLRAPVG
ncbi:hypothetical protein [Agromyces lapidis]|uniref:Uncharacterized protein n=1 Tax=Agromyces lapidis TaxID=279574 RepID=A0ABV5SUH6_9MICO|nr:hypothetical protein [Agromyces lapidis]